jgi:hypothetical protein
MPAAIFLASSFVNEIDVSLLHVYPATGKLLASGTI